MLKKLVFLSVALFSVLFLSACSTSLEKDVRFMPKEEKIYIYEYTDYKGDVELREERYEEKIGDYVFVTNSTGNVYMIFKENEDGLFFTYSEEKDKEKLKENLDSIKFDTMMEYPVRKGKLKVNGDYTYRVESVDSVLKTPFKEFDGVVKIDLLYKNKDLVFTYYLKEDFGVIGIKSPEGKALVKEVK